MYTLIQSEQLELRPGGTLKFEGDSYGVAASFFHVKSEPGMGSTLHQHPYPEVWIVRAGTGRFTVGEATIEAGPGQIIVAAANVPHKYQHRRRAAGDHRHPSVAPRGPAGVGRDLSARLRKHLGGQTARRR